MKVKDLTQERIDQVVSKFQKYGVGLVMTGYVGDDAENQTLWHHLVYPNRVTGNFEYGLKKIENKYYTLFKKANEVEGLADAVVDPKTGPLVSFSVLDELSREITITWEELAIFAYAVYKKRQDADAYGKQYTDVKKAKERLEKNLPLDEIRKRDQAMIEEFEKTFGKVE